MFLAAAARRRAGQRALRRSGMLLGAGGGLHSRTGAAFQVDSSLLCYSGLRGNTRVFILESRSRERRSHP